MQRATSRHEDAEWSEYAPSVPASGSIAPPGMAVHFMLRYTLMEGMQEATLNRGLNVERFSRDFDDAGVMVGPHKWARSEPLGAPPKEDLPPLPPEWPSLNPCLIEPTPNVPGAAFCVTPSRHSPLIALDGGRWLDNFKLPPVSRDDTPTSPRALRSTSNEVKLHVYDLFETTRSVAALTGLPIYHLSVEVHGAEYYFGVDGIIWCPPGSHQRNLHKAAIPLGQTRYSQDEAVDLVRSMAPQWPGHTWRLFGRNCHSFAIELTERLGLGSSCLPREYILEQSRGVRPSLSRNTPWTACAHDMASCDSGISAM